MSDCLLCFSSSSTASPSSLLSPTSPLPASPMRHHRAPSSPNEQQRPSTASAFHYHLESPMKPSMEGRWSLDWDGEDSAAVSQGVAASLSHTTPVVSHDALNHRQVKGKKRSSDVSAFRTPSSSSSVSSLPHLRKSTESSTRRGAEGEERKEKRSARSRRRRHEEGGQVEEEAVAIERSKRRPSSSSVEKRPRSRRYSEEEAEEEKIRQRRGGRQEPQRQRKSAPAVASQSIQSDVSDFSVEWQKEEVTEEKRSSHSPSNGRPQSFHVEKRRTNTSGEECSRADKEERRRLRKQTKTALAGEEAVEVREKEERRGRRRLKEKEKETEREREMESERERQKKKDRRQEGELKEREVEEEREVQKEEEEKAWEDELDEQQRRQQRRSSSPSALPSPSRLHSHLHSHPPHHHPPLEEDFSRTAHPRPTVITPRSHSSASERRHPPHSSPSHAHRPPHHPHHHHSHHPPSASTAHADHLKAHNTDLHESHTHHVNGSPHHVQSHHGDHGVGYQTEPIHSHGARELREEGKDNATATAGFSVTAEQSLLELPELKCPSCSHHFHTPHTPPPPLSLVPSKSAPSALSISDTSTSSHSVSLSHAPHHHHLHHNDSHHHTHHGHHHHPHSSPFSLTSRLPRLLSCSHTFCTHCLTASLAESSASTLLPCPLGCASTLMGGQGKDGVLTVELNDAVIGLIEELKGEGRKGKGRGGMTGSLRVDGHLQSNGHSIFCDDHPTHPLTLYCVDCSRLICLACTSPLFPSAHSLGNTTGDSAASLTTASMRSTGSISMSLTEAASHRGHVWRKKEVVLLEWQQSALQSSLLRRVSSERDSMQRLLGQLSQRLCVFRDREDADISAVDEAMQSLRSQVQVLLDDKEKEMKGRLHIRHLHAQAEVEAQRRSLASELNDLHLLSIKAERMEQVRAQAKTRRQDAPVGDARDVRVNGLTRAEIGREEEDIRDMRWISDLIRTFTLERRTRAIATQSLVEEERVRIRTDVAEVTEALRVELQRRCVVIDHPPLSVAFTSARVVEKGGEVAIAELSWEASGEDAVADWRLEVQETRKSVQGERKGKKGRRQKDETADSDDSLGLAAMTLSLTSLSSPSPSSFSSSPFMPVYTGCGVSFSHPIALDSVYTFRLRAVNPVGASTWVYTNPLSSASLLAAFAYLNDHCGLSRQSPHTMRVIPSTLHPHSSPPSHLLHHREDTAVATLPHPSSSFTVDCGGRVVLTAYTLWDGGKAEWRRRVCSKWRLWGSEVQDEDAQWKLIEERGRGEVKGMGRDREGDREWRVGVDVRGCAVYEVEVERSRNEGRGYRFFKWEQVGTNADADHSLVLGGLEVYGLIAVAQRRDGEDLHV